MASWEVFNEDIFHKIRRYDLIRRTDVSFQGICNQQGLTASKRNRYSVSYECNTRTVNVNEHTLDTPYSAPKLWNAYFSTLDKNDPIIKRSDYLS